MNIRYNIVKFIAFMGIMTLISCVKDRNFESPESSCTSDLKANATYSEIKDLYVGETMQIQDDLVIEGYVISSDEMGNFFGVLYFQDRPIEPKDGFQIEIDLRDSHLFYPIGSKIFIKLKGLYLGKSKGVFKIGGVFTSFGSTSVGRLPKTSITSHIFLSCDEKSILKPTIADFSDLHENLKNTLVQFSEVEFVDEELGLSFAIESEETERTLIDCNDNKVVLQNSGFSDFQAEILPEGNGTIEGVLLRENNTYNLVIRDLGDIDFSQERCMDLIDEFTSTEIFISELADPDNNTGARFVELYNSNTEAFSLKGWTFRRYTNSNTEVSSSIDLSDHTILGKSTFVISSNATEFMTIYGFDPDMGVGSNSPADSNGDDNLELVDPFGTVIDTFGLVGEDGTGTDHEFEDGRAVRNPGINMARPIYDSAEWTIFNDSGNSGTIMMPQNAPEDFTPGIRN